MSITFTKNVESQNCMKHIDIQHHYIKKPIKEKKLSIEQVGIFEIPADDIIKAILSEKF